MKGYLKVVNKENQISKNKPESYYLYFNIDVRLKLIEIFGEQKLTRNMSFSIQSLK